MKFKLLVDLDEVRTSVAKIEIDDDILVVLADNDAKAEFIGNELKPCIEQILRRATEDFDDDGFVI